jgi:hypothetical protein
MGLKKSKKNSSWLPARGDPPLRSGRDTGHSNPTRTAITHLGCALLLSLEIFVLSCSSTGGAPKSNSAFSPVGTSDGSSSGSNASSGSTSAVPSLFLSGPSITAGACTSGMTVTALDATRTPTAVTYPVSVVLTLSAGEAFVDPTCSTSGSTLLIPSGSSSTSFYYRNSTAQAFNISAADSVLQLFASTSTTMYVTSASASRFSVTGFPSTLNAGVAASIVVTAIDPYGNQASSYTGAITLSSTDTAASMPAAYTYSASDKGVKTFSGELTLFTAGQHTIIATDLTTSTVTGSQTGITIYELSASTARTSITGTTPVFADGTSTSTISIYIKDVYGNGVTATTPTFSADNTSSGNTYGACSASSVTGLSTCTLASTVGESKTLTLTSPVTVTYATPIVFNQLKFTPITTAGAPYSFGSTAIDATLTVTLTNVGSTAVTGITTALTGVSYGLSADTCNGATLGAAASCTLDITFNASAGGTASGAHTASILATGGGTAGTNTIYFTGTKP